MKILYIANIRLPTEKAHGIQIMKMCEAFTKLGHEVKLVVPWRFNPIKEDPFLYYVVRKRFQIKRVFSVDLVKFGKLGFWIQSLSFACLVFWYTLLKRTDVIYSRDELPLWYLSFFKKNVVWEVHMPRWNFLVRSLMNRLKKVVVISQGLKDFYVREGISEGRILVAHDGVDLDEFTVEVDKNEIRTKLDLPLNKPIAMYIGLLDRWKGVETLLDASLHIPEVQVVIIGEGVQLNDFKRHYPHVIFKGSLPYRDLPYNQHAADVLVIPNSGKSKVSRLYTSPLKVFAHMTSGIPIIASDLPSLREILDERNSMLVKSDNPEALAHGIKTVMHDERMFMNRAQQAEEDIEKYTWSTRAHVIIGCISK